MLPPVSYLLPELYSGAFAGKTLEFELPACSLRDTIWLWMRNKP